MGTDQLNMACLHLASQQGKEAKCSGGWTGFHIGGVGLSCPRPEDRGPGNHPCIPTCRFRWKELGPALDSIIKPQTIEVGKSWQENRSTSKYDAVWFRFQWKWARGAVLVILKLKKYKQGDNQNKSSPLEIWQFLDNQNYCWSGGASSWSLSSNVTNMFSNWHKGIESSVKGRIRVGVCALVWAIWNYQNDVVFNKTKTSNCVQVIYRALCIGSTCGLSFFLWSSGNI
jgi:hypothetical protein